jgi:hypothetical protein
MDLPGYGGAYNILLKMLENLPKLPHELRNLPNARHRLSLSGARQLKIAVEGLKKTDFDDLVAAADEANTELDRIIVIGARRTLNKGSLSSRAVNL